MRASTSRRLAELISPNYSTALFTMDVWVTGAPIATDPSPNVTPPAANRIARVNPYARSALQFSGSGSMRVIAIGGTSVTYAGWFFDEALATWVPFGIARTITLATSNIDTVAATSLGAMMGAKFFCQVTAQVGGVTNFGHSYF